jgi:hypothetical protein
MHPRWLRLTGTLLVLLLFVPSWSQGQSIKGSISGTVTDPSGAVVPDAECTLRAVATEAVRKVTSGSDGLYRFENLERGVYDLEVTAKGFQTYVQKGISLNINAAVTVKVALQIGASGQTVEVIADASPLNFETATQQGTITPEVLANLPLEIAGSPRSAAAFVVLMPGVSTGTSGDAFNSRINGGMLLGGEASLDGASMQEGIMGQSGMNAIHGDYPLSPEAISEVNVLTSNYSPQCSMGQAIRASSIWSPDQAQINSTATCASSCATQSSTPASGVLQKGRWIRKTNSAAASADR